MADITYEPDVSTIFPQWNSDNKEYTLRFNLFNGNCSWNVFRREQKGRPIISLTVPLGTVATHIRIMRKIVRGGPDMHDTLHRQDYDPAEKKFTRKGSVIYGKNDKGLCYISISTTEQSAPICFTLRQSSAWVPDGSDANTLMAEGSVDVMSSFINTLTNQLPVLVALSRNKNAPRPGGFSGGGGNGGGYQKNNYQSNNRPPEQSARDKVSSGDDDVF